MTRDPYADKYGYQIGDHRSPAEEAFANGRWEGFLAGIGVSIIVLCVAAAVIGLGLLVAGML